MLLVLNRLLPIKGNLFAERRGDRNAERRDEEKPHDDKGKDPLQRDDFEEQLMDRES